MGLATVKLEQKASGCVFVRGFERWGKDTLSTTGMYSRQEVTVFGTIMRVKINYHHCWANLSTITFIYLSPDLFENCIVAVSYCERQMP